uniref:SWIM-type domain-containing protein n=1 Tax=Lactuca sativa TaxID=4236 RepID=A0A9R1ULJ5_LACSA|nr:hypothetical protein LSAT_V11C800444230 [Lactuca sativa]
MPFAPFVGVNHHGQSIFFGGALLENEKEETFVWLFENFLKCMFSKYPKVIIIDQDKVMGNAIKKVFPNTRHRFCEWHIKKNESEHLLPFVARYSDFQESYRDWVNSDTIEEFEKKFEVIRSKYNLEHNCWISEMYNQRIHWAKTLLQRYFLGRFVNSSTMLNAFVVQYDKAVESRRAAKKDEDFKTMNSRAVLSSVHPIEANAVTIFKNEWIEAASNLTHETLSKSKEEITYRVGQLNIDKTYWRIVSFRSVSQMNITCSCAMYETSGILCKHCLYVMKKRHVETLPSHYILLRWTLNARYKVGNSSIGLEERNNENGVMHSRDGVRSNFTKESPSQIEKVNTVLINLLDDLTIRKKPKAFENASQDSSMRISQKCRKNEHAPTINDYVTTPLVVQKERRMNCCLRKNESFLHLKGQDSSEEHCELMYGFLPCSSNVPSHIFLIVIYEYLLYHGESYVAGDGGIFLCPWQELLCCNLLDSLPESLILLATLDCPIAAAGLTSSKEKAQEYVVTGVGLLAGSSILLLTLLWGGFGVVTDAETKYHVKVIFFSLIPFVVILLPSVFGLSYSGEEDKIVLLVSLSVSVICLLSYFYYQTSDPRIRERRLEYAEVVGKIEMDVPFYKVQALMLEREKHLMTKQKEMEKILTRPELSEDKTLMTSENFYDLFQKWLDETRQLMDDPYSMDQLGTEYNQVAELLLEDKIKMIQLIYGLGEELHIEDGARDESSTDRFFKRIDANDDKSIRQLELKNYIMEVNNGIPMDEEIIEIIMRGLDIDGNGDINHQKFKSEIKGWLDTFCNKENPSQNNNQEMDRYHQNEAKAKTEEKYKAMALLIVGIIMLTVLAEPLVESVRRFSESVKIEPFYVSFILVPLATNVRTAIAPIRAAMQKKHQITSLTLSEIYHKVFMNNILGFSVLVSVIYCRGLTLHFSAEILVVAIVCIIMGLLASFKSKFPNWTLIIAFSLYPLSLVMVYFVADTFQFS